MRLECLFPDNARSKSIINLRCIPCRVRIGSTFEITFTSELENVVGIVYEWDHAKIRERVFQRAGGVYLNDEPALISFKKINSKEYYILELEMFIPYVGWCPIIKNGDYAQPHHYLKAIGSRENEEEVCLVVGDIHNKELKKRLFVELDAINAKPVNVDNLSDLYNQDFETIKFNYYQFPLTVKNKNACLMLEGAKGVVNEILEKINKQVGWAEAEKPCPRGFSPDPNLPHPITS